MTAKCDMRRIEQDSRDRFPTLKTLSQLVIVYFVVTLCVVAAAQERMGRIPAEKMTPAQKRAADEFLQDRGKPITGPFIPLLRSPEVLIRAKAMGDYLRFKSALPAKLRELAILVTARQWSQQFEWFHHSGFASEAGLSPNIIKAVSEGRRPEGMSESEDVVYDFCTELLRNHSVSDATYAKAIAAFGDQGTIDLVSLTGYYTFVSMVLNVNRTPLPKGATPLPMFPN